MLFGVVSRIVIPYSLELGLSKADSSLLRASRARNKCVLVFLLSVLVVKNSTDSIDSKKMAKNMYVVESDHLAKGDDPCS